MNSRFHVDAWEESSSFGNVEFELFACRALQVELDPFLISRLRTSLKSCSQAQFIEEL